MAIGRRTRAFDLDALLKAEKDELLAARKRAASFHGSVDIRAAGNEVEKTVRDLIARRLPTAYGVGHGHVVDRHRAVSGQFDVIVYDHGSAGLVARAQDGTAYYPFESVYAIGEVKTAYRAAEDPVGRFAEKVTALRTMDRDRPGPNQALLKQGYGAGITPPGRLPYRNPLYSFLVALETGDLGPEEFAALAGRIARPDRPSLVTVLDLGYAAAVARADGRLELDFWPGFEFDGYRWEFVSTGPDPFPRAIGGLYLGLTKHLQEAAVTAPNPGDYLPDVRSWPLWASED
jgi:hypothetical protein